MADISKIHLPSGDYDIKDTVARSIVGGAISFKISYDGSAAPNVAEVPQGVVIIHNGQSYTGTLTPVNAASNTFYLIKSTTTPSTEVLDIYDEYMVVKPNVETASTWFWEKIGDTQVDVSGLVTNVTLSKQTDTAIGTDATFTITQPTISLATDSTSGTGKVQVATGVSTDKTYIKGSASGANVAWNSKDSTTVVTGLGTPATATALTGVKVTTQPTVSLTTGATAGTGVVKVATGASGTTKYIGGSASGGGAAWNSKDSKTVVTGYGSTSSGSFLNGATVSDGTLVLGSGNALTGLGSPSTTTVVGTSATFTNTQPTITMALTDSSATGKVGVVTAVSASKTNIKAAASGTAVGANGTATVVTGYTPSTDTVVGTDSTFTVTQPTVSLATDSTSATGRVQVATNASANTTYIKGSASGANTAWNSKDSVTVLTNGTDVTVTKG